MRRRHAVIAAALFAFSGAATAGTVSIGVFSLFAPREIVIQPKDAGRYELHLGDTSLGSWTGGDRSAGVTLKLRNNRVSVIWRTKTLGEAPAKIGDRIEIRKDGVDGTAFSFTLSAGASKDALKRNYRGSLHILIAEAPDRKQAGYLLPVVTEEFEQYCAEVVASELPAGMPLEAMKAQAVVCRSYATFYRTQGRHSGYDFCDTTHCQYWKGADTSRAGKQAQEAAEATNGEVLTLAGQVVPGFFCGCCAGTTATPELIWGTSPVAGAYSQVSCPHPPAAQFASWSRRVSWADLCRRAGVDPAKVHLATLEVGEATPAGGYVRTVLMNGTPIPAERFRSLIAAGWGWSTIPGLAFTLRREGDDLIIEGRGSGHGIGLCQAGAVDLARRKKDYRTILSHYFPNLSVGRQQALRGVP